MKRWESWNVPSKTSAASGGGDSAGGASGQSPARVKCRQYRARALERGAFFLFFTSPRAPVTPGNSRNQVTGRRSNGNYKKTTIDSPVFSNQLRIQQLVKTKQNLSYAYNVLISII